MTNCAHRRRSISLLYYSGVGRVEGRELKGEPSRAVEELNLEDGGGRSVELFGEPWNALPKMGPGPVTEQVWSRAKWLNNALDTVPVLTIRTFAFQSEVPVRIQSSQCSAMGGHYPLFPLSCSRSVYLYCS